MTGTPANSGAGESSVEPSLGELRAILLEPERRSVAELRAALDGLEGTPRRRVVACCRDCPHPVETLRLKIRDARDEMIEALYPIIGQTVVRAVAEAVRDLARTVDAQMRATTGPRRRSGGGSRPPARCIRPELALRDALPFSVSQVFLIHQETGLLLQHVARDTADADTDLIGAMLTAIRDFTEEAFGRGRPEDLDAIQVGDRRIVIEAAQRVYLAAVVDGVEPAGFRAFMRDCVVAIAQDHAPELRDYDGDATPFDGDEDRLRGLMATAADEIRDREGDAPADEPRAEGGDRRAIGSGVGVLWGDLWSGALGLGGTCPAATVADGYEHRHRGAYSNGDGHGGTYHNNGPDVDAYGNPDGHGDSDASADGYHRAAGDPGRRRDDEQRFCSRGPGIDGTSNRCRDPAWAAG